MATQFVTKIEEFGRTEIWNKRCEETVAWEKTVGITAKSKRPEGQRRRGGDFSDLQRRRLTKEEKGDIAQGADERVLNRLLGRLQLDMMERLHGLQTRLLGGGLE